MRENNLLELYKKKLKELNESNGKYSSLYLQIGNPYDKFTIDSFHFKFNQISNLKIDLFNFRFHYNPLFFINDIRYNLIYLSLTNIEVPYRYGLYPPESDKVINASVLKIINELISLKYLKLCGFNFIESFVLKLSHLKKISIENCENIIFENNIFSELNTLELKSYSNIKSNSLLNCPEIKECFFDDYYSQGKHNSIINFSSMQKLEKFTGHWKDFLLLENYPLKEIKIGNSDSDQIFLSDEERKKRFVNIYEEDEQKLFEKICSIKSLKSINFCKIIGNSLPKIKMVNESVSKITVRLSNNLNHLQKIFPNLTDIAIRLGSYDNNTQLAIKEIIKSKIKKFSLTFSHSYFTGFPIFSNNCNEIFNNLKIFHLKYDSLVNNIIMNIYNNINNMPNLEDFKIIYKSMRIIDITFKDFISKILHAKFISKVKILKVPFFEGEEYTTEELEILFPDLNFNIFSEISITKIKI